MRSCRVLLLGVFSSILIVPVAFAADETVATTVYAKIGNGYQRKKAKDGSFKPEYYALSNGGRIFGTITDLTVERVPYEEVAEIAKKVLARQSYQYAQTKEQAKLLLVLNWGSTLAPNGMNTSANVGSIQTAMNTLQQRQTDANAVTGKVYAGQDVGKNAASGFNRGIQWANNEEMAVVASAGTVESQFLKSLTDDRVRDELNKRNAQVLGYMDDLADSNDIRRYAGGGDRYQDLISDVEESRYYIVISAYDFKELTEKNQKKLLWQTRVSVRSPGNSFDSTMAAMLKSASHYFGQNSGHVIRGEETKGSVELGEIKYLGEAKPAKADDKKAKK
jgi:hypothetical protein